MKSELFSERLRALGFTGVGFAEWLGVSENSVSNWKTGNEVVPGAVEKCVQLLFLGQESQRIARVPVKLD